MTPEELATFRAESAARREEAGRAQAQREAAAAEAKAEADRRAGYL